MTIELHLADCREVLRGMADCSVDAVVTDPPYLINFMGQSWDRGEIAFDREVWTEVRRVLKPGGHALAFGGTTRWHWLACAMELAGLESRGSIAWLFAQGMPHGLDLSKALDRAAGVEREVVGEGLTRQQLEPHKGPAHGGWEGAEKTAGGGVPITAPATPEAEQWAGWNTQPAPAHEPIAMFRRPLDGTHVENLLKWGVGGLNVDGCRLEGGKQVPASTSTVYRGAWPTNLNPSMDSPGKDPTVGRWPPNVALDEACAAQLDAMVGPRCGAHGRSPTHFSGRRGTVYGAGVGEGDLPAVESAKTGPTAFFFCPKAPTRERDAGCEHLRWVKDGSTWRAAEPGEDAQLVGNCHSTCKPLALMRWLVRLVTPPGGLVLDPFMGSGTTGVAAVCEGMRFVGSDSLPMAHTIANARIRWAQGLGLTLKDGAVGPKGQGSLFG